jgi:hypothetical protein
MLLKKSKIFWNLFINNVFLGLAHAIGIRGDELRWDVKFNRIVLQTLTFTFGASGNAPAYRGTYLLSDSRHGIIS